MRWFLMSSPILRGGNLIVTEQGIREGVRQVMLPLWNVYHFFALYANAANNGEGYSAKLKYDSQHVMDRFILGKTPRTHSSRSPQRWTPTISGTPANP